MRQHSEPRWLVPPYLSIGCRKMRVARGCVAVDIVQPMWAKATPERFVLADTRHLPFADATFRVVLASHVLEHFGRWQQERERVVREWWRVLRLHGALVVRVPNVACYGRLLASGRWSVERFSDMVYGSQDGPGEFHHYGYDVDTLVGLVRRVCGWRVVRVVHAGYGRRGRFPIPDLEVRVVLQKV